MGGCRRRSSGGWRVVGWSVGLVFGDGAGFGELEEWVSFAGVGEHFGDGGDGFGFAAEGDAVVEEEDGVGVGDEGFASASDDEDSDAGDEVELVEGASVDGAVAHGDFDEAGGGVGHGLVEAGSEDGGFEGLCGGFGEEVAFDFEAVEGGVGFGEPGDDAEFGPGVA